ncbi:LysR family transcriptional activator of mexEF-oprN operon [Bradyrhizobium sp. USDA 3397]
MTAPAESGIRRPGPSGGNSWPDEEFVNLARQDLNLLVAFDSLMRERHVSRAATRIGLSQSAMSHLLQRLRQLFDDNLFVRTRDGMTPSPRALELDATISLALAHIREALKPQMKFLPEQSVRRFVLGMNDAAASGALPKILRRVRRETPNVTLAIVGLTENQGIEALLSGRVELALDVYADIPQQISRHHLAPLELVCLVDRHNPLLRDGRLDERSFFAARHIRVTPGNELGNADIDRVLGLRGAERLIACETPFFSSVPELVRGTDLVGVVGQHLVEMIPNPNEFAIFPLPIAPPDLAFGMIWHRRSQEDAGHRWLRHLIADTFAGT